MGHHPQSLLGTAKILLYNPGDRDLVGTQNSLFLQEILDFLLHDDLLIFQIGGCGQTSGTRRGIKSKSRVDGTHVFNTII